MMVSGRVTTGMVMVYKHGPMVLVIRVTGRTTKLTERVNLFTSMAISTKDSGKTTKQMDLECTSIPMERCTRATGRMTIRMERVLKNGWMVAIMKEPIEMARKMDKDTMCGPTVATTVEIG